MASLDLAESADCVLRVRPGRAAYIWVGDCGNRLAFGASLLKRKPSLARGLKSEIQKLCLLLFCGRCSCLGVLAAEALDAAGRVHQLLLAGKKWMAIGADFHVNVALVGRAGSERMAARAEHANLVVCRMNSCLHGFSKSGCEPFDSKGWQKDSATADGRIVWETLAYPAAFAPLIFSADFLIA